MEISLNVLLHFSNIGYTKHNFPVRESYSLMCLLKIKKSIFLICLLLYPPLSHFTFFSHWFTTLQTFWFSFYSCKFHCSLLSAFVISSAWNALCLDLCLCVSFSSLRFLYKCHFLKETFSDSSPSNFIPLPSF